MALIKILCSPLEDKIYIFTPPCVYCCVAGTSFCDHECSDICYVIWYLISVTIELQRQSQRTLCLGYFNLLIQFFTNKTAVWSEFVDLKGVSIMNRSLFESIIIEQFQTKIKTATFIPSHHLGRLTPKAFSTICSTNFHHHLVSIISFLLHNPIIHAFANIDLTINQLSLFSRPFFQHIQRFLFPPFFSFRLSYADTSFQDLLVG